MGLKVSDGVGDMESIFLRDAYSDLKQFMMWEGKYISISTIAFALLLTE
jgi:hypothetical protein